MSVGKFMKSGGWAAMAVALAVSGVATDASAQGRGRAERMAQEREGGDRESGRLNNAFETRARNAEQRAQQAEQRSRQVARSEQRNEQLTAQVQQRGERTAEQAARPGNWQGNRQADRRNEQSEQRSTLPELRVDPRVQRRDAQRAERNRTYTDQARTRTYATNGTGRGDSWQGQRRDNDTRQGDRRDNNDWQRDRRDGNAFAYNNHRSNDRQWDHSWRDNGRYDWQRYRNGHRSVYNLGVYSAPYRYYTYRRFGVGSHLNSLFFGSSYWINNPWQYRLPEVWGPYRWVRYYDDVMLVDIYTGQVVDVIHNFFW